MIKKTLFTFLVLTVVYALFVSKIAPPWWQASQHQWQGNVIKAQRFMYRSVDSPAVLVGSSLAFRLLNDSLPGIDNLAFSGQSIYEGLTLLEHKKELPKLILLETNLALRPGNEEFTSSILFPLSSYFRREIPALREENQPLGVAGLQLNNHLLKPMIDGWKQGLLTNGPVSTNPGGGLFGEMLALKAKEYSTPTDPTLLKKSFDELQQRVTLLEKRGTRVVFFEMPINYQLEGLAKPSQVRDTFHWYFPLSVYISPPPDIPFHTTDGLHLRYKEAAFYSGYLRQELVKRGLMPKSVASITHF